MRAVRGRTAESRILILVSISVVIGLAIFARTREGRSDSQVPLEHAIGLTTTKGLISSFQRVKEGMPLNLRKEIRAFFGQDGPRDLRFDNARTAATPDRRVHLWLASGPLSTCIFRVPALASSCAPTVIANRQGLMLEVYSLDPSTRRPETFTVYGVAPDNAVAALVLAGDQTRQLPVKNNVFYAKSRTPLRFWRLRWANEVS